MKTVPVATELAKFKGCKQFVFAKVSGSYVVDDLEADWKGTSQGTSSMMSTFYTIQ